MTYEEARNRLRPFDVYKHYKDNYYEILAVAKHSETDDVLVVYRNVYARSKVYARPVDMWFDDVGDGIKRFEKWRGMPKQEKKTESESDNKT